MSDNAVRHTFFKGRNNPPPGKDPLLSIPQAAESLGLKVPTIRDWIYRRKIEFVRIGRAVRIRESAIREIIDRGTVPARREQ